ncbi:MAG: hypothetical protein RLZZ628_4274 [Bacteroidota bacterium]|jgi:hypothetical protein
MQSIFKIFQSLQSQSVDSEDGFNIVALPNIKYHKLGVSPNNYPMFFIKSDDNLNAKSLDSQLEFITVQFNRECQLFSNTQQYEQGIYTIIALKTDSSDLQAYFLEIIFVLVKQISELPKFVEVKQAVEKLINLFSKFSKPPVKTIQGLWAELLIIEQSKNPDYLVKSWHYSPSDKFDFNDGTDKLEVKSTAKSKRIHAFSIEQLNPNRTSNLLIASVFAVETGIGKSIVDLITQIEQRLKDKNLLFRLNEMVVETLGKDFEKTFDIFFDYQLAIDTLQFYQSVNIPTIEIQNIPKSVINIRFDCDLTDIKPVKKIKNKSLLHNALF